MNLKVASALARRHLAATVVVLLVFAGAAYFLVKQYLNVFAKREQLLTKQEQLDSRELRIEKQKTQLEKKEFLLNEREKIVSDRESNVTSQEKLLEQKTTDAAVELARLQHVAASLSILAQQAKTEAHVQQLADDISDMGGLNDLPLCGDSESIRRFGIALSKYRELLALGNAGNESASRYASLLPQTFRPYGCR